jgi:hypothetical protein
MAAALPSRVTISFLLAPDQIEAAFEWADWAAERAAEIDPKLMVVEGYRVEDGTAILSLRSEERPERLAKLIDKHEGVRHFRIRLADQGLRVNISVGALESDAPEYQIFRSHEQDLEGGEGDGR